MTEYKTINGLHFLAEIQAPVDYLPIDNFAFPRRLMRVMDSPHLTAGDVFQTPNGRIYLCCFHSDSEHQHFGYRTFRIVEMTEQTPWYRLEEVIDTATGVARGNDLILQDNIWIAFESKTSQTDKLRIPRERARFITPQEVKKGDVFRDEYTVEDVDAALGVYVGVVI